MYKDPNIINSAIGLSPQTGRGRFRGATPTGEVIKLSQQLEMAKFKSFWKESETAEAKSEKLDCHGNVMRIRMVPSGYVKIAIENGHL